MSIIEWLLQKLITWTILGVLAAAGVHFLYFRKGSG